MSILKLLAILAYTVPKSRGFAIDSKEFMRDFMWQNGAGPEWKTA
jgi:hypothetical protein